MTRARRSTVASATPWSIARAGCSSFSSAPPMCAGSRRCRAAAQGFEASPPVHQRRLRRQRLQQPPCRGCHRYNHRDLARNADEVGFVVHPRRWVVERTFAWLGRNRRLSRDFEATIASATAFTYAGAVMPLARRLARSTPSAVHTHQRPWLIVATIRGASITDTTPKTSNASLCDRTKPMPASTP